LWIEHPLFTVGHIKLRRCSTFTFSWKWKLRKKWSYLIINFKDVMQGKVFQECTHLLYCSVLSLGGNVNTRRMSKPPIGSIIHIKKNQWNILVIGNYYVNYQNYQNLMLLTSSDTKRTLMHLSNSAQRETGFNVYAEYTRRQLTFLALHPWLILINS